MDCSFSEMYSYSRTLSGAALVSIRILANVGPDGTSEKILFVKKFLFYLEKALLFFQKNVQIYAAFSL